MASRASCSLVADRRLCLTGTPVQNKLDDVYALIKFLRLAPLDDKSIWTEYVGGPVKFNQPIGVARLQTIMKCITLRRTKESRGTDGEKILELPPRSDEIRYLEFDEREKKAYDAYFAESYAEFNELDKRNEVMKNYVGILQKILRLRQICDHLDLVKGKGVLGEEVEDGGVGDDDDLSRAFAIFMLLKDSGTAACVECGYDLAPTQGPNAVGMDEDDGGLEESKPLRKIKTSSRVPTRQNSPSSSTPTPGGAPRAVLTRCQHLYCLECFRACVCPGWPNVPPDIRRGCSVCQTGISPADAIELSSECTKKKIASANGGGGGASGRKEKRQKGSASANMYFSTKIRALMCDLAESSRGNPHSRNYDPENVEIQMVDENGNGVGDGVVKTVVLCVHAPLIRSCV